MWQDDEDNNPYGSFHPDSNSPALDTSCESRHHPFTHFNTSQLTTHKTMTSNRAHLHPILPKMSRPNFCRIHEI